MRLKYTRKHCKGIFRSNAHKYLSARKPTAPQIFRYFYTLHIFTPWTKIDVDVLTRMLGRCRATTIKNMRKVQDKYGLPHYNQVTVKDYCKYYQHDIKSIQQFFFSVEWNDFQARLKKLKHK